MSLMMDSSLSFDLNLGSTGRCKLTHNLPGKQMWGEDEVEVGGRDDGGTKRKMSEVLMCHVMME